MNVEALQRLARLYGVLPAHRDGFRRDRRPTSEALHAVLGELGADLERPDDLEDAIRSARAEKWSRLAEPVVASRADRRAECVIRLPESATRGRIEATLCTETGDIRNWTVPVDSLKVQRIVTLHGRRLAALRLPLRGQLPAGYHRLLLQVEHRKSETLLIRFPGQCASLRRTWGVFVPLYALHSQSSPAAGTFSELGRLTDWVQDLGGGIVSTLPLLAQFLGEPFAPSPYTPVSRCFWNEFYVDLAEVPEWSPELGGAGEQPAGRHVDYRRLMRGKRFALEKAAAQLRGVRRERFAEYVRVRPELRAYAAFRASFERDRSGSGAFELTDPACLYHAYSQWVADEQVSVLAQRASVRGPGLYLDLPLGTHPLGFDTFRHPGVFVRGASGGAPPDRFFSRGQNWGFAPMNPRKARESGHAYFIASLRHHLRCAGVLRIDHLMGLHRMYWIPDGFDGDQGVYVQYPADELYAIVCLESCRHGASVVGEDLGTVPAYVRQSMKRHGLRRTHVAQFEFRADREPPVTDPPCESVATVNTHDTAMFATFWAGGDVDDQEGLGLLDSSHAMEAREHRDSLRESLLEYFQRSGAVDTRDATPADVLDACLEALAKSAAECVIVTLEDLWGETEPQNTPGTDRERPNWQRRTQPSLESILSDPAIAATLRKLNRFRQVPCRESR